MGSPKQAGVGILISDNVDFKPKLVKKDKEIHSILIKETLYQKEITINLYVPNINTLNYTSSSKNEEQAKHNQHKERNSKNKGQKSMK
jgi:hypothetical protein